jgi:hypothetical protein
MSEHGLTLKGLLWGEHVDAKLHSTHAVGHHVERRRRSWGEHVDAKLHTNLLMAMSRDALAFARLAPRPVMDEALHVLESILDKGLGDILTSAWVTCPSLQEAADPARHGPDEVILVPLLEHTVSSKQEPAIDFTCGGVQVGSLKFAVALDLQLSGVVLRVKASRIHEIASGTCDADAKLSVADIELAERKTPKIALPLSIQLGAGIPIPRAETASA